MKLKHWWWWIFPPSEMQVDHTIFKISASHPANEIITAELAKEFIEKYFK